MSFEIKDGVLVKYHEEDGETAVVIPDSVTSIGYRAFEGFKSIMIPESVKSIGENAFAGCHEDMEIIKI